MKRRAFCVLLVLMLLLSACSPSSGRKPASKPTPPGEVLATGRCGDNVTWTLDSNGLFTVSGTGTMTNYGGITGKSPPWYENRDKIKSVVIENGVTTVGKNAFYDCGNLTSVTVPASVTAIGRDAFTGTPWLESLGAFAVVNGILVKYQGYGGDIVIPDSVTVIGYSAFYECKSLTGVTIPDSVTGIMDSAFRDCSSLTMVTIGRGVTYIGMDAFDGCRRLADVSYSGEEIYIDEGNDPLRRVADFPERVPVVEFPLEPPRESPGQ